MRVFSYGGGVQSTAALVLAAEGKIDFPVMLFANVGEDSEYQGTLDYLRIHAKPYAARHGIELIEVAKKGETLLQRLIRRQRSIDIPVRMANGAPGNRNCTLEFKIKVIARWTKEHGATKDAPATVGIGISTNEAHRATTLERIKHQRTEYPLLDLRMSKQDCLNIITRAGLPIPPKSSCWFCPFHTRTYFNRQRRDEPEIFQQSVALERLLNERRESLGKDPVWLTSALIPLDQVIVDTGQQEFDLDSLAMCESGYCMT